MGNDMEKNTLLLEQCKEEMDRLASQGDAVLSDAVAKTEKQARACMLEWKQAQKTVELTAKQHKSVDEARAIGEEKLAAAVSEEKDARIAAETVRRMIEDANAMHGLTNTDTAKILKKAGEVLLETEDRALACYNDKKAQREEIDAALQRLDATEKAVLYTIAKAERNASEKMLVHLVAERRQEVCAAKFDSIRLQNQQKSLFSRRENETFLLNGVQEKIASAEETLAFHQGEEETKQKDLQQLLAECKQKIAESNVALEQRSQQYEMEKEQINGQLEQLYAEYTRRKVERERSFEFTVLTESNHSAEIAAARAEEEKAIQEIEANLEELRTVSEARRAAYEEAVAKHKQAVAEADRLQNEVIACSEKVRSAAEEEHTAQEAAQTALRLADSATKIRQSINNESSELLFHAQEVLMEAAASAQQLSDEKGLLRLAAEQEYESVKEQAAAAAGTVEEAALQVELMLVDCRQTEQALAEESAQEEPKKKEYAARAQAAIAVTERELQAAKEAEEEAAQEEKRAKETLDQAEKDIKALDDALSALQQEKEEAEALIYVQMETAQTFADKEFAQLSKEKQEAANEIEVLKKEYDSHQVILSSLDHEVEQVSELVQSAKAKVDDIIAVGVLDIISAEEALAGARYKEDAARKAAEAVLSYLGGGNGSMRRFSSLQSAEEEPAEEELAEVAEIEIPAIIQETVAAAAEPYPEDEAPVPEAEVGAAAEAEVEAEAEAEAESMLDEEEGEPEAELILSGELADLQPEAEEEESSAEIAEEIPAVEKSEDLLEKQDGEAQEDELLDEEPDLLVEDTMLPPEAEKEEDSFQEAAEEEEAGLLDFEEEAEQEKIEEEREEETEASQPDQAENVEEEVLIPDASEETKETPEPVAAETIPTLTDLSGLTKEEVEYTQRLELMGNAMVAETFHKKEKAEPDLPVKSGAAYVDWMEQLARSLREEGETDAAEAIAKMEEDMEKRPRAKNEVDLPIPEDDDMPVIQDVVLQVAPPEPEILATEEDDLRLSILNTVEEKKPETGKKRRFPFLNRH